MLLPLLVGHCGGGGGGGGVCGRGGKHFGVAEGAINHFKLGNVVGDFIPGLVIVPLAHDLFGVGVVQGGEELIGELANQVFFPVDFKRVERCRGFHG